MSLNFSLIFFYFLKTPIELKFLCQVFIRSQDAGGGRKQATAEGPDRSTLASCSEKLPRNLLPSTLQRFKKFVLPMFARAGQHGTPIPTANPNFKHAS